MEVEELLNLFDSCWFQKHLFSTVNPKITTILESNEQNLEPTTTNPVKSHKLGSACTQTVPLLCRRREAKQILENTSKLSRTPTVMVRSQSDQCLTSKDCTSKSEKSQSPSPISVLIEPKLQPILSGKEYNEFQFSSKAPEAVGKNRKKRKSKNSKSLSELEFEELKGFMDLGFEFSDKDKDSRLVTIIPGLRRLGKENEVEEINESGISRPHLSEAWDVWEEEKKMEEKKKKNALKSWKINSDFGNEMEVKDQLKLWAHSVASTVR
ncbi:hypothetical protein P3S68_004683 [Capsicum galapagoense]